MMPVAGPAAHAEGDAGRGKALAEQRSCGTCHGAAGISALPKIPSLAAHPADFIVLQLILMREGIREAPPMNTLSKDLTDEQIEEIREAFNLFDTDHSGECAHGAPLV